MLEKLDIVVNVLLIITVSAYLSLLVYRYLRKKSKEADEALMEAFLPVSGAGKRNQNALHEARRERLKKERKARKKKRGY